MATGAGEGLFRCVFDGCISGCDLGIERRPYHRNCGCALHKSRGSCSHVNGRSKNVSYPIRRAWSEGCLALAAASCHSSPSSSPAATMVDVGRTQLGLSHEQDKEDSVSFKVSLLVKSPSDCTSDLGLNPQLCNS